MEARTRIVGEREDKEDFVRSILVIVLASLLNACSILDRINFDPPSLDPSKIYLSPTSVVSVAARQTHRYACVDRPLLCINRGVEFECRCP